MKVALIIDWLNTKRGGGEGVLLQLAGLYPEADIFTLIYNPELYPELKERQVATSFLQKAPHWLKQRSRYLLPLIPTAIEQFDLSKYDVVISASSGWGKGVITKPETLHVCYCFSPMRMVWDYWPRYLQEQRVGPIRRAAIHYLTSKIRLWDYYSAARVDKWVPISETVGKRIQKFYHRQPEAVIYPGTDLQAFKPLSKAGDKKDYYLVMGTLTPYKRVELAIQACNQLGCKLIVAGDGADRKRLEELSGPTIEFVGRVSDAERTKLLAEARGFIFPGLEDFGLTPVEAMASGTPVIGFGEGGVAETVVDGKTGVLFSELSAESLAQAITRFEALSFRKRDLIDRAKQFSLTSFQQQITRNVNNWYKQHVSS